MNATAIREKLHHFIDRIEDKKAVAMYTIFEANIREEDEGYTKKYKAELDRRYAGYKNGGKSVSRADIDKRVKKILNKAK